MSLYKVDEKLRRLIEAGDGEMVDSATGEVYDEAALDALQMERRDKIEGIIKTIKNAEAKAKALKEEADKLSAREKALTNKALWLRGYLARHMDEGETFDSVCGDIRWRKTDPVIIDVPVEELPERFVKVTRKPMLNEIKKAIKDGETVPGARLDDRKHLIIK